MKEKPTFGPSTYYCGETEGLPNDPMVNSIGGKQERETPFLVRVQKMLEGHTTESPHSPSLPEKIIENNEPIVGYIMNELHQNAWNIDMFDEEHCKELEDHYNLTEPIVARCIAEILCKRRKEKFDSLNKAK
jgi:hypothetical protein